VRLIELLATAKVSSVSSVDMVQAVFFGFTSEPPFGGSAPWAFTARLSAVSAAMHPYFVGVFIVFS
jgi:hypothetical protein